MPTGYDAAPDESCADCGRGHQSRISWSPAFRAWLCTDCRGTRTRAELAATEKANEQAADLATHLAAIAEAGDR